jgi:hypothetical protein
MLVTRLADQEVIAGKMLWIQSFPLPVAPRPVCHKTEMLASLDSKNVSAFVSNLALWP